MSYILESLSYILYSRIAILWHELWHEGLEEASRLFFGERDVAGMFETLDPLHEMMDKVSIYQGTRHSDLYIKVYSTFHSLHNTNYVFTEITLKVVNQEELCISHFS